MAKSGYISPEGVARKTPKIYIGDESNLARKITKAYIGEENGLAREWFSADIKIGTLAVGSSVFMNVDGVRTEFLVVHQGLPSSDYDSSCNGTWLLMKDLYKSWTFDSTNHDYENSDIHSYLNNTFVNLFDSDIKSAIKQVKIPYRAGSSTSKTVTSGSSGLSAKVFLLSFTEVGLSGFSYAPVEGAALSHFNGAADSDRIGYLDGTADEWWLRTPSTGGVSYACIVNLDGSSNYKRVTLSFGVRPALILPSDAQIDENFNVIA